MEPKKTQRADLQNKKSLFFKIGLAVALLLMIGAFSISQPEVRKAEVAAQQEIVEQDMVEITRPEPPKPPENVVQRLQITSDILEIVRDDRKIEAQLSFADIGEDVDFTFNAGQDAGDYEGDLDEEIVFAAEEPAVFSGGDFSAYIQKQVGGENYPVMAQQNGIQGRVTAQFVVERDGSVSGIKILSSPDRTLSDAVVKAIQGAPKWTPAKNNGLPVRSWFTLPVTFKLQ